MNQNEKAEHEAKKKTFKSAITLLTQAKIHNAPDFAESLDAFAEEFANQVILAKNIDKIEQDINSVNKQIYFLDEKIKKDAKEFYKGIDIKYPKLKSRLIEARENMSLHLKNGNHKAACKYIVVQAEAMCNQLSDAENFDFINWIKKQGIVSAKVSTDTKGNEYLSTANLLTAADLRFKCQTNPSIIKEVKDIRDYESHGYPEHKVVEMEILLTKIISKWKEYESAWDEFLNKLIDAFYYCD